MLLDDIFALLPSTTVDPMPYLVFKLSTDSEDVPWEPLVSEDDWDYAISRVRNKKAQQHGNLNRSVDVRIGYFERFVCHLAQLIAIQMLIALVLIRSNRTDGTKRTQVMVRSVKKSTSAVGLGFSFKNSSSLCSLFHVSVLLKVLRGIRYVLAKDNHVDN